MRKIEKVTLGISILALGISLVTLILLIIK